MLVRRCGPWPRVNVGHVHLLMILVGKGSLVHLVTRPSHGLTMLGGQKSGRRLIALAVLVGGRREIGGLGDVRNRELYPELGGERFRRASGKKGEIWRREAAALPELLHERWRGRERRLGRRVGRKVVVVPVAVAVDLVRGAEVAICGVLVERRVGICAVGSPGIGRLGVWDGAEGHEHIARDTGWKCQAVGLAAIRAFLV